MEVPGVVLVQHEQLSGNGNVTAERLGRTTGVTLLPVAVEAVLWGHEGKFTRRLASVQASAGGTLECVLGFRARAGQSKHKTIDGSGLWNICSLSAPALCRGRGTTNSLGTDHERTSDRVDNDLLRASVVACEALLHR